MSTNQLKAILMSFMQLRCPACDGWKFRLRMDRAMGTHEKRPCNFCFETGLVLFDSKLAIKYASKK
jgi:hypothetical protein